MDLNANSRNPKIRPRPLASPEIQHGVHRTVMIFKNRTHPKNYEKIFNIEDIENCGATFSDQIAIVGGIIKNQGTQKIKKTPLWGIQ